MSHLAASESMRNLKIRPRIESTDPLKLRKIQTRVSGRGRNYEAESPFKIKLGDSSSPMPRQSILNEEIQRKFTLNQVVQNDNEDNESLKEQVMQELDDINLEEANYE